VLSNQVLSNQVLSSGMLSSGMLNSGLSSSGLLSSRGSRGGVSSLNVQSSDNRKIQGLRGGQIHIDPVLEIVKAPGARGIRALGLRARGLRALGLRAGRFRAGRLRACRLRACMAHARGLRGCGHRALVQRDWPAGFKLSSRKPNDTPGSSTPPSGKVPWRFPGCPAASES